VCVAPLARIAAALSLPVDPVMHVKTTELDPTVAMGLLRILDPNVHETYHTMQEPQGAIPRMSRSIILYSWTASRFSDYSFGLAHAHIFSRQFELLYNRIFRFAGLLTCRPMYSSYNII
jgi:hypothetical protein